MSMEDGGTGGTQAPSSPSCHGGGLLGLGLRNASALSCVHPANVILFHPIYRLVSSANTNAIPSIKKKAKIHLLILL